MQIYIVYMHTNYHFRIKTVCRRCFTTSLETGNSNWRAIIISQRLVHSHPMSNRQYILYCESINICQPIVIKSVISLKLIIFNQCLKCINRFWSRLWATIWRGELMMYERHQCRPTTTAISVQMKCRTKSKDKRVTAF
jgi:hypothetical protein